MMWSTANFFCCVFFFCFPRFFFFWELMIVKLLKECKMHFKTHFSFICWKHCLLFHFYIFFYFWTQKINPAEKKCFQYSIYTLITVKCYKTSRVIHSFVAHALTHCCLQQNLFTVKCISLRAERCVSIHKVYTSVRQRHWKKALHHIHKLHTT